MADRTRAIILDVLLDGRALPASDLARLSGVTPQTISAHLTKLVEGNLLQVETQGRHRYYRLSGPEVANALEAISLLAPPVTIRSLRQSVEMERLREARTCYDHLAGQLGVALTRALVDRGWLQERTGDYIVTEAGAARLERFGVDLHACYKARRHFAKPCLDWSERRHHLGGALGAAISRRLFELAWIEKDPSCRAVRVTALGKERLFEEFGLES